MVHFEVESRYDDINFKISKVVGNLSPEAWVAKSTLVVNSSPVGKENSRSKKELEDLRISSNVVITYI